MPRPLCDERMPLIYWPSVLGFGSASPIALGPYLRGPMNFAVVFWWLSQACAATRYFPCFFLSLPFMTLKPPSESLFYLFPRLRPPFSVVSRMTRCLGPELFLESMYLWLRSFPKLFSVFSFHAVSGCSTNSNSTALYLGNWAGHVSLTNGVFSQDFPFFPKYYTVLDSFVTFCFFPP